MFIDFSALLIRSLLVDVSHVKEIFFSHSSFEWQSKAKHSIFSVVRILLYNETVPILSVAYIYIYMYTVHVPIYMYLNVIVEHFGGFFLSLVVKPFSIYPFEGMVFNMCALVDTYDYTAIRSGDIFNMRAKATRNGEDGHEIFNTQYQQKYKCSIFAEHIHTYICIL